MRVINRDEAAQKGLKKFYTGRPCVRGHFSERYVSTQGCVQCLRGEISNLRKMVVFLDPRDHESVLAYVNALKLTREATGPSQVEADEATLYRMIANYRKSGCPESQIATMRTFGSYTMPDDVDP